MIEVGTRYALTDPLKLESSRFEKVNEIEKVFRSRSIVNLFTPLELNTPFSKCRSFVGKSNF